MVSRVQGGAVQGADSIKGPSRRPGRKPPCRLAVTRLAVGDSDTARRTLTHTLLTSARGEGPASTLASCLPAGTEFSKMVALGELVEWHVASPGFVTRACASTMITNWRARVLLWPCPRLPRGRTCLERTPWVPGGRCVRLGGRPLPWGFLWTH